MILGIDFDNTLVCYDGLFHAAAVAGKLLPAEAPGGKRAVRERLIQLGREDDFTRLQGWVYGPGLKDARPYPDARECLRRLSQAGAGIKLISHKTRFPILGPAYDLRQAAWGWLEANGWLAGGPLAPADVFFEDSLEEKAARVAKCGCTHFVDDLERFFRHPAFPTGTIKLWFRPPGEEGDAAAPIGTTSFASWREIEAALTDSAKAQSS